MDNGRRHLPNFTLKTKRIKTLRMYLHYDKYKLLIHTVSFYVFKIASYSAQPCTFFLCSVFSVQLRKFRKTIWTFHQHKLMWAYLSKQSKAYWFNYNKFQYSIKTTYVNSKLGLKKGASNQKTEFLTLSEKQFNISWEGKEAKV